MHYGAYAFSKNGRPTIVSKRGNVQLGQRNGLSDKDKEELRRLYGCTTTVTSTVKPTVNGTVFFRSSTASGFNFLVVCTWGKGAHFKNNIGK